MDVSSYFDEEDCLAFKIFVAELELIIGSSRGKKKADVGQCYQLLQKLVITLERTDRAEVREYQRRCEDALIDILLKGAPPPVRRLICEALGKMYSQGDQLPLFSRVSSLQLFLGTKEAFGKETSEDIRLGALELMTSLYYSQGKSLSIGVQETAALAVKYCSKNTSDRTRRAALRLLASAIEGVGSGHRDALAVQQDALKALDRLLKEKDLGEHVKLGAADVLRAIAAAGGGQLWASSLSGYDFARNACFAGIQDSSSSVRAAFARALGEIVNASTSLAAKQSIEIAGTKPKYQQAQEKALAAVPDQCLAVPFAECAAASDRKACTALSQAWVWHLIQARLACGMDESLFVDPALKPLESLAAACIQANGASEKGFCGTDGELGSGISGGERPHAQACVLYILRAGVIEQLGEKGQRSLLQKMSVMLSNTTTTDARSSGTTSTTVTVDVHSSDSDHTIHDTYAAPPPAVVTSTSNASYAAAVDIVLLEVTALLVESLGEIEAEVVDALEHLVCCKLIGPHAAVRIQAASTLAALAVGNPGSAARLMSSALKNLRDAADALVEEAAAGPDKSRPAAAGTPRGPGSNRFKSEMNALHGWAIGAGALVAAIPRLPLGLPSHYMRVAMQLAGALVEAPRTKFAAATCLERESGYILLGSLCHAGAYEALGESMESVRQLWVPAFGTDAMKSLEDCLKSRESYAEYTVASELWWRTMALQSLYVFVQACVVSSPLSSSVESSAVAIVNDILRPLLALVMDHLVLRAPGQGRGGLSSPLAGASAMLQLRLLQVYSLLAPWLNSASKRSKGDESSHNSTAAVGDNGDGRSNHDDLITEEGPTPTPATQSNNTELSDTDMLCTICMENVRITATAAATSSSFEIFTTALHAALDEADDHLGPWPAGADPLEKALLRFQGAAGGPLPSAWEAGLRLGVGYALDAPSPQHSAIPSSSSLAVDAARDGNGVNTLSSSYSSTVPVPSFNSYKQHQGGLYPQCHALAPILFSAQCHMLGIVLRSAPAAVQIATLGGLLSLAQSVPSTRKDKDAGKRTAVLLAAAAPVVMGFSRRSIATGAGSGGGSSGSNGAALLLSTVSLPCSPKLSQQVKLLAEELIIDAKHGNISVQRAAAELFAASATLGGDTLAIHIVKELCQCAAETPSLPQRASLSLAIGISNRVVGGLSLSSVLPLVSQTLTALAMASNMAIVPWVLHSLMNCALAAGLSFVQHVKGTLSLAHNNLLHEDIYFVPGLLPAVGRLTNTMVATLGPEYILGSAAYDSCRSVVAELRAPDSSGVRRPEDMLAASLESVLYAQMLVLFAPRALPSSQNVKVLIATLPSRQPQLRKAAADTLRHLAEGDPDGVLAEHVEPALLAALDSETDPSTARQIQATLRTLLHYGAASQPWRWISLCGEVVSAAASNAADGSKGKSNSSGSARSFDARRDEEEEDNDDDGGGYRWSTPQRQSNAVSNSKSAGGVEAPSAATASPASVQAPPPSPGSLSAAAAARHVASVTPRLRTRLFAAKCLLRVPAIACPTDDRHTDLIAAQRDVQGGDWLVCRVQHLVDLGFKMATGQLDALRSFGVELMRLVLSYLGAAIDPLSESRDKLLVQYQAQYVSTLRASLATTSTPSVFAAGASLAATFLEKGLAGDDTVVLDRLLQLLCAPLGQWTAGGQDSTQATYAEWVSALTRVAMLESHAHCAVLVSKKGDDTTSSIVLRAQGPFFTLLVECWIGLLHDYSVLRMQERRLIADHQLLMYGKTAPKAPKLALSGGKLAPSLNKAWPTVLAAAASTLMHDRTAAYGPAGKARHESLLDLAISAVYWSREDGHGGDECLFVSLHALHILTSSRFIKEGWLLPGRVDEILSILDALVSSLDAATNPSIQQDSDPSFLLPSLSTNDAVEKCAAIIDQLAVTTTTAALCSESSDTAMRDPGGTEGTDGERFGSMRAVLRISRSCLSRSIGSMPSLSTVERALSAMHHVLDTVQNHTSTIFMRRDGDTPGSSSHISAATVQHVYCFVLYQSLSAALEITSRKLSTADQLNAATDHIAVTTRHAARFSFTEGILTYAAATAVNQASEKSGQTNALCIGANVSCMLILSSVALHTDNDARIVSGSCIDQSNNAAKDNNHIGSDRKDDRKDGWADAEFASAQVMPSLSIILPSMKCTPTQQACLFSLGQILSCPSPTTAVTKAQALSLAALVVYLQQRHPPPQWATECMSTAMPPALAAVHGLIQKGTELRNEWEILFVVEALKLAVIACSSGDEFGKSSMHLSIPILVESAAPPGESTPIIAETAVKLLTSIASGPCASEFKSTVAGLPEELRRRLQLALAAVAGSSTTVSRSGGGSSSVSNKAAEVAGGKHPKIQLKMFGSGGSGGSATSFTRSLNA